jgi:nitrate reductase NapAB chaperone NapD
MPIKSFIAHPLADRKSDLISALESIKECEVIPSTNKDVVVIVTETQDKQSDIELIDKLNNLESIQMLSMVSGFDNKVQN